MSEQAFIFDQQTGLISLADDDGGVTSIAPATLTQKVHEAIVSFKEEVMADIGSPANLSALSALRQRLDLYFSEASSWVEDMAQDMPEGMANFLRLKSKTSGRAGGL